MKAWTLAVAAFMGLTAHAEGHCFKVWHYRTPQGRCGVHQRITVLPPKPSKPEAKREARNWTLDAAQLPPITDEYIRALAVEKLRAELREREGD